MSHEGDSFRDAVELRLAAEFGSERDAERVAEAAARARADAAVEWSPSFVADRMATAPKDRSVPEKWNWLLSVAAGVDDADAYAVDTDDYEVDAGERTSGPDADPGERPADSPPE